MQLGWPDPSFSTNPIKEPFVIGGVLIGTFIAVLGIYDVFIPFLVWLGVFIPPMGGIIFGDHFAYWSKVFPKVEHVEFKTYRAANWIAYILASIAAIVSSKMGIGIPSINGFVAAIIFVFILKAVFAYAKIEDNHKIDENADYIYR